MNRAELRVPCKDGAAARGALAALQADDPGSFFGRVEGATLILVVESQKIGTLRATLDDLLACLRAAEAADP